MEIAPGDFLEHRWNDHLKPLKVVTVRRNWIRVAHKGIITGGINVTRKPYFNLRATTVNQEYDIVRLNGLERARSLHEDTTP